MGKKISRRSFSKKTMSAVAGTSILGTKAFSKNEVKSSARYNEYDYIIVGSGAGGGPLACNLARHGFKVLVLEAGNKDSSNYLNEVPAFHAKCSEDSNFSWHFYVKHYSSDYNARKDSKYVSGKGVFYPRGATIGGSTINNAMVSVLPHDSDFDHIARITGDDSWSARNMKKYKNILDKSFYLNYYDSNSEDHGRKPWLPIRYPDLLGAGFQDPVLIKILSANLAHNRGRFIDFITKKHLFNPNSQHFTNGGSGAVLIPQNADQRTAKRHAVREYLLETARIYPNNLTIATNALVSKVVIKDKTAVGVEYLSGAYLYEADPHHRSGNRGSKRFVKARREVILSAGAFNSPQLLKLSGIGPRNELNRHGIPVIQDLPGVGRNLQDRYEVTLNYKFKRNILDKVNLRTSDPGFHDFYNKASGPYTSNGAFTGNIIKSNPHLREADVFNFALIGSFRGYVPGYSNYTRSDKSILSWAILKGRTNNSGDVLLRNRNPQSMPLINFKFFNDGRDTNSNDIRALVHSVKHIRSLMKNFRVKPYHNGEVWPGDHVNSDHAIKEFVKNEAWGHHASCTNKIGSNWDSQAVLDSKFRVRGIKNLRVVDASVFPKIPGFFISVPIYIISEKATDDILSTAGVRRNHTLLGNFFKNKEEKIHQDLLEKEQQAVSCYPNPFKDKLIFDFRKSLVADETVNIWLWDQAGNLIKNQTHNNASPAILTIDVSDVPSGTYVYIFQSGSFEKRGKLIKE